MAFKIVDWILRRTDTQAGQSVTVRDFLDNEVDTAAVGVEVYLRKMAFWSVVRKIGAAVGAVEWETYRRGKKVKAKEYWSWNYAPNPNQTREQFFAQLVGQLYLHQEALIVETRQGYRYVADSYGVEPHLEGDVYSGITSHEQSIPGFFGASDVLRVSLTGDSVSGILSVIGVMEGKLLKGATSAYLKSRGRQGILHISDTAEASPGFEEIYEDLVNNKFRRFFESENAVLPLFDGFDYKPDETASESTKASLTGTRDIHNLMNDIIELTAQAMGVPVSIATGKGVTEDEIKVFVTDVVRPIATALAQDINRKTYGRDLVYSGTYIRPNLSNVRYTDVFDVANPIDKLISSGAFCVNDIRIRLGLDPIDEPWAEQHWMTKNYSPAGELVNSVETQQQSQPQSEEDANTKEVDSDVSQKPETDGAE